MSTHSKLTKKYQATIPQEIRNLLNLKSGDSIIFEIINGQVTIKKAQPMDIEFIKSLESNLTEWNSTADEEAYGNL